ncbi:non-ribosomal peptide synthetase [Streptomyces sp. SRF1]|uniref:non-ribosomal peptide synthetase n=1 Tax=Streptomyces sp. SRF1 TaxID=1549642 RepID=UPI0025B06A7F|nr:non-ribosomal peptide synthetase [Streptomyces sp. SRF1]MDN3058674.1 non-ribosomal peptide synthetase [Streptomyces sp. SRF1]
MTRHHGRPESVLQHIVHQSLRRPGAIAAQDPAPLTYRQLAVGSDRLAASIRAASGARPPVVGVLLPRGNRLLVALLAVLRLGGTYLPLNPDLPPRRLAAVVDDARPDVVLAEGGQRFGDLPVVRVDFPGADRADGPGGAAPAGPGETGGAAGLSRPGAADGVSADTFAYLLFTSGSTGRPKGVVSGHPGLYNRLSWMQDAFGLSAGDRVLQKTPVSFDVSVWELLWPLMYGGTVVFAKPGGHVDGRYLHDLIQEQRITIVHFVPSMLGAFLRANPGRGDGPGLDSVRLVVTSGEALTAGLAAEALKHFPSAELYNLYGPTEASIDATFHRVVPADLGGGPVPIGRPITGMAAHVVGPDGRPVPPGETGELWLSGVGLARGYLNRPEATAAAFVTDPPYVPADRVYRTGDLVRDRGDGVLEYLGRDDRQVKFRGVRIELSELDGALAAYPGVARAHTALRRGADADQLIAFVEAGAEIEIETEAEAGAETEIETEAEAEDAPGATGPLLRRPDFAAELREHLACLVPASMVPTHFAFVRDWPVTVHGKLDTGLLLTWFARHTAAGRTPEPAVATREIVDRVLAIFREVLGTEDIDDTDSFFEVGGGGSLAAVRAANAVEEYVLRDFGLDVSADASVFIHPTARELADEIERGVAARTGA